MATTQVLPQSIVTSLEYLSDDATPYQTLSLNGEHSKVLLKNHYISNDSERLVAGKQQLSSIGQVPSPKSHDTKILNAKASENDTSEPSLDDSLGTTPIRTLNGGQRFDILKRIGEGSYGHVWNAQDLDLNRPVAIKSFKGNSSQATHACQAEVEYTGSLDHPSIPTIYDTGRTEQGVPYVVMKYLDGMTLTELVKGLKQGDEVLHKKYSFEKRIDLVIQLLRALRSAHNNGVLHRDIKPDNILIGGDGCHIWLIDWGCAIDLQSVKERSKICGTPLYMPPEQALGEALSPASDLFALASTAYELLCLEYAGPVRKSIKQVMYDLLKHQPKWVDSIYHPVQGYVPSEYSAVIMQALYRSPKKRPQSAEEMIVRLEATLAGHVEVVCERSLFKSRLNQLMSWVNHNPIKRLKLIRYTLISSIFLLIGLGVLLGSLLGS